MNDTEDNKIIITQTDRRVIEPQHSQFVLIQFCLDLLKYLRIRFRQISLFIYVALVSFLDIFTNVKSWSVRRMYWGRGSLYRSAFHVIIFTITLVSLFVGISNRINIFGGDENQGGLVLASGVIGNTDTLYQAGTTETIAASNPDEKSWPEFRHIVKQGETLATISDEYGVSSATIKWANNLSSDRIRPDQVLIVPGLDGVLYEVKKGETVDSIVKSTTIQNANAFDIIELNGLEPPNYALAEGQQIFIPNAVRITPRRTVTASAGTYVKLADPGIDVTPGTFVNPLSFCPGYSISRGVLPWHTGVDMAKPGGCWVNASATGTVEVAGWGSYGQGFHVMINHHNGFISYYYHGNGEFAVTKGQQVNAGQKILYMGCTGNCTGTHVHFEMRYNGAVVNPAKYMGL